MKTNRRGFFAALAGLLGLGTKTPGYAEPYCDSDLSWADCVARGQYPPTCARGADFAEAFLRAVKAKPSIAHDEAVLGRWFTDAIGAGYNAKEREQAKTEPLELLVAPLDDRRIREIASAVQSLRERMSVSIHHRVRIGDKAYPYDSLFRRNDGTDGEAHLAICMVPGRDAHRLHENLNAFESRLMRG